MFTGGKRALACAICAAKLMLAAGSASAQQPARPTIQIGELSISGLLEGSDEKTFRAMVETALIGTRRFEIISTNVAVRDTAAVNRTAQRPGTMRVVPQRRPNYVIGGRIAATSRQINNMLVQLACPSVNGQDTYRAGLELTIDVDLQITEVASNSVKRASRTTKSIKDPAGCMSSIDIDGNKSLRLVADEIALETTRAIYPIAIIRPSPMGGFVLNYGNSVMAVGQYYGVYGDEIRAPDPSSGGFNVSRDRIGYAVVTEVQSSSSVALLKCMTPEQVTPGTILEPADKRTVEPAIRICDREANRRKK